MPQALDCACRPVRLYLRVCSPSLWLLGTRCTERAMLLTRSGSSSQVCPAPYSAICGTGQPVLRPLHVGGLARPVPPCMCHHRCVGCQRPWSVGIIARASQGCKG